MNWSLNEIESLARRAARGAGLDWGLAEEAGKAVRWLSAAGWPGGEALAALLEARDQSGQIAPRPEIADGRWRSQRGPLCPIATGAALGDRAAEIATDKGMILGPVAQPILLVPFIASSADATGTPLRIGWPGAVVSRGDGETRADITDRAALTLAQTDEVIITPGHASGGGRITRAWRGDMAQEAAKTLADFASRTYAPATPESRLSGAGAGLTDND